MKRSVYKKHVIDRNVYELALERIRHTFDMFDRVAVSFSGGKDSTVCLNLALQVARERGRLPLDVFFWDEEVIPPETIEYCKRVMDLPDVRFRWLALPITRANSCSYSDPWWYPWDPECPELWVRELPPWAETELEGFNRHEPIKANHLLFPPGDGTVAVILGIRADESLSRYRAVASKREENYISHDGYASWIALVKPIYDWTTADVWVAPHRLGWDYNRSYDVMYKAGISPHDQRVAPPYGQQQIRGLWQFKVCWPEMWDRMVNRVPGAATAARYANTELYAQGGLPEKPADMTWQEAIRHYLNLHHPDIRGVAARRIRALMNSHFAKTSRPIPEHEPDANSGISWPMLLKIAIKGDLLGRITTSYGEYNERKRNKGGGGDE